MKMAQETKMDMWTPFKDLQTFIEEVVSKPVHGVLKTVEEMLRNHKQNFITLLKNPAKNAQQREELKKALAEGTPLPGLRHQLLTKELVDETLIISDMYELNEYMAFDLLCTAQQQMPHHPGLPRGLVAVLLYYDGRKSLVYALKALVQARKGISWVVNASEDLVRYITWFTKDLMDQAVLSRIIGLLETLDLTKEIDLLHQNRAIGGPRHHRQVVDLYQSIRQGLADIIYCWSAQCGLPKTPTFKLINYLKSLKMEEDALGNMDNISVTTQMALLYALDLSVLHTKEDGEDVVKSLPLLAEQDFMPSLLKEFQPMEKTWETPGLQGLAHLTWALALATLRNAPATLHSLNIGDEDELLVDSANELNVFDFLHRSLLQNQLVYTEEFYLRRLHTLITDFIVYMPMKVKEMKSRSDESARTIQTYMQEGLEPPQALPHHFEHLLLSVAQLYEQDPLKLELSLQYWCPTESLTSERFLYRTPPRQVALFKFIRLGGDILPPAVFVPYMKMLRSLASSPRAARNAFNFLKQNGNGTVSWTHFFKSLEKYYSNLRQELPPTTDTVYQPRSFPRGILPQEIHGLQAVLGVVRAVAEHDPVSRVALSDSPQWAPMNILLGLVACAVPIPLKAELLLTLAALAKSAGPATALWYSLEASQILSTVPSTSSYQPRGVQTELEEIESRNEEFPLTRALLHLLNVLTDVPVPRLLGVEARSPGFDPYLNFIVNSVFLRFNTRSYKNPEEKWDVAHKCLKLLKKFLAQYNPDIMDFTAQRVELQSGGTAQVNPVPGYHIMVNLNSKTELLRLVLHLVDEGVHLLDNCTQVPGQAALEGSMLNCLLLLQHALALQGRFFELLASSGNSLLLTGLRRLLLDVNPRSGKPDHLLNIAKYVTYSGSLPNHALAAVRILLAVSWTPSAQTHLLSLFTSSPELTMEIRHGFVECLEADEDEEEELEAGSVQSSTKEAIFKLLQQCLHYSAPNVSHYLFGFDLKKVNRTVFQQPGVLGFPRTCLHSLLSILDKSLGDRMKPYAALPRGQLLESCYCMLYLLCSDVKTSGPVLRFLRSCGDFLCRHLAHLPFQSDDQTSDLVQMSWLLKVVAVELKATARNDQMSSLANLVNLLTREQGDILEDPENRETFPEDKEENLSRFLSRKRNFDPTKAKKLRVLLALLNQLDFHVASIPQPEWEFFVPKQLAELSAKCEVSGTRGQSIQLVDVKKLHKMMLEELAVIQSSTSAAQRSLVLAEIEKVLKFTIQQNSQRARCHATVCYMDAWRQVTEILFCVCPRRVLPEDVRLGLLVDCLHVLLKKVLSHQVIPNLAALSSGVILLLSVALHHCLIACQEQELATVLANSAISGTSTLSAPIASNLAVPGRPGIFDIVLSNILEWIINSGVASQKLRSNLYGALLMFVRMTCRDPYQRRREEQSLAYQSGLGNSTFVSRLDASEIRAAPADTSLRRQACLEIIMGFGEGLIDVLCHDCTGGHDVCKMLALSCLGLLIEFDPHTSWISHLSSRGYLRHIVDSLLESDGKLTAMLGVNPHTLSPLYVYESKMAMLCRVAASHTGAELLLELGAFGCLANMSVFDKHPDFKPNLVVSDLSFVPTARSRYQQILFPALDLCNAVLTTLGPDNQACCVQIQLFLFSHYEMLSIILRCVSPLMQVKFLKELAHITGIIARVSHHVVDGNSDFEDARMNTNYAAHVQSWMLELMRHFRLSEGVVRELRGSPPSPITGSSSENLSAQNETQREDSVLQFLQVACNLVLFARNIVAGKGLDRKIRTPLFTPQLEEFFSEPGKKEMEEKEVVCPPLGLVVEQLVQCVGYHQREKANLDLLQHKKMSLGTVNYSLDMSEIVLDNGREPLQSEEGHALAARALDEQIDQKRLELAHCAFLVDNCLYLIWCHLSYFAEEASGRRENIGLLSFSKPVTLSPKVPIKISKQEISALKQGLVSTFNDRFSKQLMETQQEKSAIDKGFVEALLRRIKRLIQFTRDLKS
ncbi:hypothetical protein R5R35_004260 [Gryllus longicercus]|uniref:Nuclear pore complex protein Nup205 n=1 Tax=Gryllus longicercus TaxID=2509291 RepID=A0AAN9VWS8_9ORTH